MPCRIKRLSAAVSQPYTSCLAWSTHCRAACPCLLAACPFSAGIIGAGRIGTAYARMMMEGHKMNVVYFDVGGPNKFLEEYAWWYNKVPC